MYREVAEYLLQQLGAEKPPIILILGMRQTGKSTLAKTLVASTPNLQLNFDLVLDRDELVGRSRHELELWAKRHAGEIVLIDEVQKAPEAIEVIKHLYDSYHMRFVLTGSSKLKLRKGIGDSLAGRVTSVKMFPLSLKEQNIQQGLEFDEGKEWNNYEKNQVGLLNYLVYGSMPKLMNIAQDEYRNYLLDYTNALLTKDVLELGEVRKPTQVYALAKLLAQQVGQLVNVNELAVAIEMSRERVYHYIDILEQMGIIVRAKPISTNEREAIGKATKIYFVDLGVRNAIIDSFDEWHKRQDKGQILENAVFVGRMRQLFYARKGGEIGFFRSKSQSEIDVVVKQGVCEELYEVKTTHNKSVHKSGKVEIITMDNAQKFLY